MSEVPAQRVRRLNSAAERERGDFVLYWMVANRRTRWNFSLQRAVAWAQKLRKPLVVLEALRIAYPWASERLHFFVVQGMAANARALRRRACYYPYLEPTPGAGRGLLQELAKRSCVVVSDDFPCFFLPRMLDAAATRLPVRLEVVDSNGLLPLRAAEKVFSRAFDFRRFLQKNLAPHLTQFPREDPLFRAAIPKLETLPAAITRRWPVTDVVAAASSPRNVAQLPLQHDVRAAPDAGGMTAATARLTDFVTHKLVDYKQRNIPDQDVASGLSPYLHFGHISPHQVFAEVTARDRWNVGQLSNTATGSASGWWRTSSEVESFLDELITWRELGFNMCWQRDDYDQYDSLPAWAKQTLEEHRNDRRSHTYSLEEFEHSQTHDALWNAAQRQLVTEGRIHNYLRMLWGKKILEWTHHPRLALEVMIELNNKYALDGRNPNSYSGIFWVLGRYDRAWGPERPVFGKVRYMSSQNTARKVRVRDYLARYAA